MCNGTLVIACIRARKSSCVLAHAKGKITLMMLLLTLLIARSCPKVVAEPFKTGMVFNCASKSASFIILPYGKIRLCFDIKISNRGGKTLIAHSTPFNGFMHRTQFEPI